MQNEVLIEKLAATFEDKIERLRAFQLLQISLEAIKKFWRDKFWEALEIAFQGELYWNLKEMPDKRQLDFIFYPRQFNFGDVAVRFYDCEWKFWAKDSVANTINEGKIYEEYPEFFMKGLGIESLVPEYGLGQTCNAEWYLDGNKADKVKSTEELYWLAGNYPDQLIKQIKERLQRFTEEPLKGLMLQIQQEATEELGAY